MNAVEANKSLRGKTTTVLMISHEGSMTGAPLFLERLARGLSKSGYRLAIFFSEDGPIVSRMRADGFEIYCSKKRPLTRGKFMSLFYRLNHYFYFFRTLWFVKPDIVYSNTIVNCGEALLSRVCGFPTLVHMHEGMNFASKLKRRLALQAAICNDIIVGSEYAGRVLFFLTGKAGAVIPIGVGGVPVSRSACSDTSSILRVGILGTLDENKGQMLALEALAVTVAKGVNIQLIVAGAEIDSNYSFRLKKFVVDNGLESRVVFLGQIDSIDCFFRSIDVLAVCSYDEVFPTVILEAMREKKLVVATRVGGIPEIIENGCTGFLYEPGNAEELIKCLIEISVNRKIASEIIDRAYIKFADFYEISNSILAISRKFGRLLGERTE